MLELTIPEAAHKDDHSVEMMRAWIAEKGLHISLNLGVFDKKDNVFEAKAWAIMMADALRHIANALAQQRRNNVSDVLQELRERLDTELDRPTSKHSGGFVVRQ